MEVRLISSPSMVAEVLCGMAAAECYQGKRHDKSLSRAMDGGHLSGMRTADWLARCKTAGGNGV